jgi:hypothetical protein
MTSLLRELVPVPMSFSDSRTMTSRPFLARDLAMARPMTPAPTTTQSTLSLMGYLVLQSFSGGCLLDDTTSIPANGISDLCARFLIFQFVEADKSRQGESV